MKTEGYKIRDRETGKFLYRDYDCSELWVDYQNSDTFTLAGAKVELARITGHCCHIVPWGWTPAAERDALGVRVRNFFTTVCHFFKH